MVNIVNKLLLGHSLEKLIHSWHIQEVVNNIRDSLITFDYVIPTHTRREDNKATDYLASWGSCERHVGLDLE